MSSDSTLSNPSGISKWVGGVLITLAFTWIGWLILNEWTLLSEQFFHFNTKGLALMLILGFISTAHNAFVFHLVITKYTQGEILFVQSTRLLFAGQIIRHLPGRFWGVVYQVNATRSQIPPSRMVRINIDFMFIQLAFALLAPITILLYFVEPWLAIMALLLGLVLFAISLRYHWKNKCLKVVSSLLPKRMENRIQGLTSETPYQWGTIAQLIGFSLSGWVFFFLAWQAIALAFPALDHVNLQVLCATYSIAWIVGFLSIITPSGLGVREAVFLFISPDVSAGSLALLAILVRLWLLFTDVILFLLTLLGSSIKPSKKHV